MPVEVSMTWTGDQYPPRLLNEARKDCAALMQELDGRVRDRIIDDKITANGAAGLLGSFNTSTILKDNTQLEARLASHRPYASYVELGTRPHYPPLRPLYGWVETKLDITGYRENKQGQLKAVRQFGTRQNAARRTRDYRLDRVKRIMQIARAIQRAIAKRGTRARLYMRTSLDSLQVPWRLTENAAERTMEYQLDIAAWLQKRGTVQRTINGMGS